MTMILNTAEESRYILFIISFEDAKIRSDI